MAHLDLARTAFHEGRAGDASSHGHTALEGLRGLAERDPAHAGWQHDLAQGELMAAHLAALGAEPQTALEYLHAATDRVDRLLEADGSDAAYLGLKASLLLAKGDAFAELGQPQAAQRTWSLALRQVTGALPRTDDPKLLVSLLALQHRTGDHQQEAELRARLRRMGYAGPEDAAAQRDHALAGS